MALFEQCTCGAVLDGQFIRKRSHFQGSHPFHHLDRLCSGGHKHLNLRGSGLAAAAAKYPKVECELILQESKTTSGTLKWGRLGLKGMLAGQGKVNGFQKLVWTRQMSVLRSLAKDKSLIVIWDSLVQPWLDQEDTLRASVVLSSPRAAAGRSTGESVSASPGSSGQNSTEDAHRDQTPGEVPRTAQDEIMFDIPAERVSLTSLPIQ